MPRSDFKRIQQKEGANTFIEKDGARFIQEIDARLNDADCYMVITRTGSPALISRIEYFADLAKTELRIRKDYTRSAGVGGVLKITGVVVTYYNKDGSVDSTVTKTVTRPNLGTNDDITVCDSPFSTTEDDKL